MSVVNAGLMLSAPSGYTIDRSLRLRSSASAYLSRTPASAGNRKTWTWSGWVKRGNLGATQTLLSVGTGGTNARSILAFTSSDTIEFGDNPTGSAWYEVITSAVYRDASAWYHVVAVWDSSNATSSDRVRLYVNGIRITSFGTAGYPPQNTDSVTNTAIRHWIGQYAGGALGAYFDGYLTEINFIDGQALDPTSFGEYNEDTGVWQPIKYVGTYGTNGFYLNFSDNSTTTTLGYDTSGNGNNWTANNISVTSGATYDSMTDVPTLTDEDAANYAVLNPLGADTPSGATLNGNLTLSNSASNQKRATIPVVSTDTNKYYWEVTINGTATSNFPIPGMYVVGAGTYWPGYNGNSIGLYQGGSLVYNGSTVATLTSFANGDVISIAFDPSTGKIWFAKNGTWMASGDPATGTSPNYTLPTGVDRVAGGYTGSGYGTLEFNFGQRPFAYTPPAGFKSLNTYNLPDSTIEDGGQYFNTVLYTGTGSTQSITGVGFQPDFLWFKNRSVSSVHRLVDGVRGLSAVLFSSDTAAESTDSNGVTAVGLDGFTVGTSSGFNNSPNAYVAWNWKANGSGVSNTDGSITSTVSANTTAGFSIVTYTGTGSAATVGHGLGVAPAMVIVKRRSTLGSSWVTFNSNLANAQNNYLALNTTAAAVNDNSTWGGALPTTSVFSIGTLAAVNQNTSTHVAYCFADVEGYSKFGSYTGNGSTDGPFVYTGFRPAFVLVKDSSAAQNWRMFDSAREPENTVLAALFPNLANAESTGETGPDFLSNGFKVRTSSSTHNASGNTIVYMAFAENPFKNSLAR